MIKLLDKIASSENLTIYLEVGFFTIMGLLVPSMGLAMFYGDITPLNVLYGFLTLIGISIVISAIVFLIAVIHYKAKIKGANNSEKAN